MRTILFAVLCCLFQPNYLCFANEIYCDPDSDGKPSCPMNSKGETYRNFWDPTRYWVCNGPGEPISKRCPSNTGYSGIYNKCISWNDWQWVPPCGIAMN